MKFIKFLIFLLLLTDIKVHAQIKIGNAQYDSEIFEAKDSSYVVKKSILVIFKGNFYTTQQIRINDNFDLTGASITSSGKPAKPETPEEVAVIRKMLKKITLSPTLFNLEKNSITRQEIFNSFYYTVSDTNIKLTYELKTDTISINTIFCQKAEGTGAWLNWEFWFAPNIPTQAGYFSISGLPGLLVQAINNNTKGRIKIVDLEYPSKDKFINPFQKEKIFSRKEFEEFKKKENKKHVIGSKVE
jgi:GLPGLI family protein